MSSQDLTAGQVMNISAALLNDANRTTYTYAVQVPYLQLALQKLQELYQLNGIPVTEETSTVIEVPVDATELSFDTPPKLPHDLVEIQNVWERNTGGSGLFIPMRMVNFLPPSDGTQVGSFGVYSWHSNKLKFYASSLANDIRIDYIRELFTNILDEDAVINVINAKTYLEFMTAGLIAEFVEANEATAHSMYGQAGMSMDVTIGIGAKGKQKISTRRRPFRSGYRR